MKPKEIVVLFDIDHTLFDTVDFVSNLYEKKYNFLDKKAFFKILEEIRVNLKEALSEKNSIKADIVTSLWDQAGLGENFYEETIDVLEKISKIVPIGIFSRGDEKFQKEKIKSILHFFNEDNIHITLDKYKKLPEIIKKYQGNRLIIVDDMLQVLHAAKTLSNDVFTVWVNRKMGNRHNLQNSDADFIPDATISNLRELILIIKKMKG